MSQNDNLNAGIYDLLIQGGTVVDPGQGLNGPMDIGIKGVLIAALAPRLTAAKAGITIDATGKLITPGLIDLHTHVYWGASELGVEADPIAARSGSTTLIDAGSAGASTFPGFRRYCIDPAACRIFAFLNLSTIGLVTLAAGEYENLKYCHVESAVRTIEKNRDIIVGVKVRAGGGACGANGITPVDLARAVADRVGMPLMVHIAQSGVGPRGAASPLLAEVLERMRPGDILTHCFTGQNMGILDRAGKPLPEVKEALARGILFDVGHGAAGCSVQVAKNAMAAGVRPHTIGTDIHIQNAWGPVHDLPTTLSKFMALGMTLEDVILRATRNPAAAIGKGDLLGRIAVGGPADLGLFELREGDFEFMDSYGVTSSARQRLWPTLTICRGRVLPRIDVPRPEGIPGGRKPSWDWNYLDCLERS